MTSLNRIIFVLALCALTGGCLTTSPEQQAQRNAERCEARGYKPGTDAFSDCVVRIDSERDARMERNRRDMMEAPPTLPGSRGY